MFPFLSYFAYPMRMIFIYYISKQALAKLSQQITNSSRARSIQLEREFFTLFDDSRGIPPTRSLRDLFSLSDPRFIPPCFNNINCIIRWRLKENLHNKAAIKSISTPDKKRRILQNERLPFQNPFFQNPSSTNHFISS